MATNIEIEREEVVGDYVSSTPFLCSYLSS